MICVESMGSLQLRDVVINTFHSSELTVDFWSNHIYSNGDFNLGTVCIPPPVKNSAYYTVVYKMVAYHQILKVWNLRGSGDLTDQWQQRTFFVRHRGLKKFSSIIITDNRNSLSYIIFQPILLLYTCAAVSTWVGNRGNNY